MTCFKCINAKFLHPILMSTFASISLLLAYTPSANASCKKPKSYYKNVVCTSDSRYYIARKDNKAPVALLDKMGKRTANLLKYDRALHKKMQSGLLPVYKNGKVGYINAKGVVAIPLMYDSLGGKNWARPANNRRIIVKKSGKFGVINTANKVIMPFGTSINNISNYSNGKAKMSKSGKSYWLNTNGEAQLIKNSTKHKLNKKTPSSVQQRAALTEVNLSYEQAEALYNKVTNKPIQNTSTNINQEVPTNTQDMYDMQLSPYKKNNKWGFVDDKNIEMITFSFDQVTLFSDGLAGVRINNSWGFVNKAGDLVIDFQFNEAAVNRTQSNYHGMPPFTFYKGKAWIGNLNTGEKLCIDINGNTNIQCD